MVIRFICHTLFITLALLGNTYVRYKYNLSYSFRMLSLVLYSYTINLKHIQYLLQRLQRNEFYCEQGCG